MTTTTATPTKAKTAKTAKPAPAAEPVAAAPAAEPVAAEVAAEAAAPAPAPVAEAAKVIEQAVAAGKDTVEKAVKGQAEAVQKVQAQAVKSSEEALAAAKENLDAVVKAGQLLSKGLQDLSKSVVVLTQGAVEESMESTKKLLAAKTLHEAVDLHSAHAKAQIDRMMAEGARLTESTRKLFEEALAPIQTRLHDTVEKLTKLNRH